jgi:hypothetical protein
MNAIKFMIVGVVALVVAAIAGASAWAADPYDGVNRIGTYYQYQRTWAAPQPYTQSFSSSYNYAYSNNYYDYVAPPRAGGFFGSTSLWITGIRTPVYSQVPPVFYTSYYQQSCGYPCYFGGGYGYPRMTAGQFPTSSSRIGGIFGY